MLLVGFSINYGININNYYQDNIKIDKNDGNYHGTDNRNGNDKDGESDQDIWLYMSFYIITTGATIAIHSARRASSSRINVLTSGGVGSGGTVIPSSSSSTVRFYLLFLA